MAAMITIHQNVLMGLPFLRQRPASLGITATTSTPQVGVAEPYITVTQPTGPSRPGPARVGALVNVTMAGGQTRAGPMSPPGMGGASASGSPGLAVVDRSPCCEISGAVWAAGLGLITPQRSW